MIELLDDVMWELAVDVEVNPEIDVVHVRGLFGPRVQVAGHGYPGMNGPIAVEFPTVDVLIPTALKPRSDREASRVETVLALDLYRDGVNVVGSVVCHIVKCCALERSERGATAMCVEAILIAEVRPWRLRARDRS